MAQLDSGHEGLSKKNFRTYSKLYRDPELFEAVEDEVLWELGKYATQNGQSAIEAWSVGCSAGEEVFSLLMSWEQALAPHMDPALKLRFYGTDLSDQAVDAARRTRSSGSRGRPRARCGGGASGASKVGPGIAARSSPPSS